MKHPFIGTGAALVTPFREDLSVNFELFDRLIDFQLQNETDAVVVCGTTGEGATLTIKERMTLFQRAADRVNGRVPLICGTGSNSTSFCLETAKQAENHGADYHLIVTPYYNKTSQQGLIRHYFTLADALQTPIIVYNVPSRTGMNIRPETYEVLSSHNNIVAVKEADPDIGKLTESIARCGERLSFYSGNDDLSVAACAVGCKGTISVLSNVFPRFAHELNTLAVNGDTAEAGRALAACDEVTHCYERPEAPIFPFNLFAMIHARSPEEASTTFARLEESCQLSAGTMLISTREYKKTSMTFFAK